MRRSMTKVFTALAVLSLALAACGGGRPARPHYPSEAPVVRKTEPGTKPQEGTKENAENFSMLTVKMDEYQDLAEVCERLARTDQNKEMRDSCAMRLRALRQELLDLTNLLGTRPE
jgi:hypothetical protein